ncbi:hypothetical protein HMPREF3151_10055 [Corynebacterium sp. HMSC05H05]|nr:hypothetical protein HMPREF3151_10055 [Corynebacterium sp. HMSC05H05]
MYWLRCALHVLREQSERVVGSEFRWGRSTAATELVVAQGRLEKHQYLLQCQRISAETAGRALAEFRENTPGVCTSCGLRMVQIVAL